MEQLSIWNDITTITQRYLNVFHGMTRIDDHPRRLHDGKNINQIILGLSAHLVLDLTDSGRLDQFILKV